MFNLFKRHNKNYNPIITTTPPTDLKNIKGVNTLVIAEGCNKHHTNYFLKLVY